MYAVCMPEQIWRSTAAVLLGTGGGSVCAAAHRPPGFLLIFNPPTLTVYISISPA